VVAIYDAAGRRVARLSGATARAQGVRQYRWHAGGHPSGVYWVRFQAGGTVMTKKVILLK
jgi:hypothetical protein